MSTLRVDTIQDRSGNQKGTFLAGTQCVKNPVATSTITTQAHGLGGVPDFIVTYAECITADNGYSVGDRIYKQDFNSSAGTWGWIVRADATNVYILIAASGILAINGTTPGYSVTLANANWKIVAIPYKLN